jgi:hypothetical protein
MEAASSTIRHHLQVKSITGVWVATIILSIGLFYLLTIRSGHAWGDDFSMYIYHAKNLAEGAPYGQTGYIYNPFLHLHTAFQAQVGPQTYPPVVPLLLTPIYYFWGLNLNAFKVELILIFILALAVMALAFKGYLPSTYLAALIIIIGFNPSFWQYKDNIVSDVPFLLFIYLSLFLIHRTYESWETRGKLNSLLVALSIYLGYGTRSIGLLLIPSLLIYDFISHRKITGFAIQVVCITGGLILLQSLFLHSDSSYADHLGFNIGFVAHHLLEYPKALSEFWLNGYSKLFRYALFGLVSAFAIAGYFHCLKRKIGCYEIFLAIYLAAMVVLPVYGGIRFLVPIIPLYLLYALVGAKEIFKLKERAGELVLTGLMAAIVITYIGQYSKEEFGPIRDGITKSEAQQFFDYVKAETDKNDTFVFRKPRALALFTGRKASTWHQAADDRELWNYFSKINARFLVLGPAGLELEDQGYLRRFIDRQRDRLERVYTNPDFEVYRIKQM